MPRTLDWRRRDIADDVKHIGKSGFAWEFLRRNRAYRRDHSRIVRLTAVDSRGNEAAVAHILQRWGLNCPLQSGPRGKPGNDSVAPGIPPDLRHRRCRTP